YRVSGRRRTRRRAAWRRSWARRHAWGMPFRGSEGISCERKTQQGSESTLLLRVRGVARRDSHMSGAAIDANDSAPVTESPAYVIAIARRDRVRDLDAHPAAPGVDFERRVEIARHTEQHGARARVHGER